MEHAAERPDLSLGVVAFSVAQRDLIQLEVELLRRRSPQLEAFFTDANPTEPFFVKNLENVQGDERDCILISIGYGRNESGRVARDFGPVNRDGGERRLNVLISRAKMAMEVFCNFRADELELNAGASHGVRALKHFLKYAQTRELDVVETSHWKAESPFEGEVIRALEERGHRVEAQVGTAGYFIDIAVKDPDSPGRYLLAIECDGAAYHGARSARDRDRLRQSVLEGLGWRFHRIWSTDWFRDSRKELDRIAAAIDAAREANLNGQEPADTIVRVAAPTIARQQLPADEQAIGSTDYRRVVLPRWPTSEPIHEIPPDRLVGLIKTVAEAEAPVHEIDVTRRIMDAFGVLRAGSRIVESVRSALRHGHGAGHFRFERDFVYAADSAAIPVRSRRNFDPADKKIDLIAPEELDVAICSAIEQGFSIGQDDAVAASLDLLGFSRASANIADVMNSRIDALVSAGRIKEEDGRLTVS